MGSDNYQLRQQQWQQDFNPRSRVGSDHCLPQSSPQSATFQSTLPRGERQLFSQFFKLIFEFQSTLPRGERPSSFFNISSCFLFQSTLPRGERRTQHDILCYNSIISIHAPAWGATEDRLRCGRNINISIHAPAWGATLQNSEKGDKRIKFQSTLPRGERPSYDPDGEMEITFQSTLPRGERPSYMSRRTFFGIFQSTLPRGERRYFYCVLQPAVAISIHAPAWGATLLGNAVSSLNKFQSTLPRGERRG